jgi:hypothetical protein
MTDRESKVKSAHGKYRDALSPTASVVELPKPWDLQHDDKGIPQVLFSIDAMRAYGNAVVRHVADECANAIKQLRESHQADTKGECEESCDFVTAWNTAERLIRAKYCAQESKDR